MFSLVHFSSTFPYIHPYLFPIETAKGSDRVAGKQSSRPDPETAAAGSSPIEEVATAARAGLGKRLKSLHRRHLRKQRNDALTYSGGFRRVAG